MERKARYQMNSPQWGQRWGSLETYIRCRTRLHPQGGAVEKKHRLEVSGRHHQDRCRGPALPGPRQQGWSQEDYANQVGDPHQGAALL